MTCDSCDSSTGLLGANHFIKTKGRNAIDSRIELVQFLRVEILGNLREILARKCNSNGNANPDAIWLQLR